MKLLETIFWKTLPFIPIIIILMVIGFLVNHCRSSVPRESIKEAVGTVIGYTKHRKGKSAKLIFKVKEKDFFSHCIDNYDIGEKFIVEYEEKNPSVNQVRLDKPVFLKNEETNITVGIVTSYNPNYLREISFIYFVNGIKYKQSYEPIEDSKIKYSDLKEGKKYKVKYWSIYPKRSIILLNEPDNSDIPELYNLNPQ